MATISQAERLSKSKKKGRERRKKNPPEPGPLNCRLHELRTALGLSLYDIGDSLELSVAGLHKIEHGGNCEVMTAWKIAEFFGKRIDEIWSPR